MHDVFKKFDAEIRKHKILSALIVLVSLSILMFIFSRSQDRSILLQKEYDELIDIPKSYTIDQILQNGAADLEVTNILDKPSNNVSYFLGKVSMGEWAVLRTVSAADEDLVVTLYVYDDTISEIRRYKYYVQEQSMLFPDALFKSPYTTNENGITTVYLTDSRSIKKHPEDASIEDDILYSYFE